MADEEFEEGIRETARAARNQEAGDAATRLQTLDQASTLQQRRHYAKLIFKILVVQLFIADLGFFLYGFLGVSWRIEPAVMNVWLGATVIEIVGVALVVVRHLFPEREPEG